MKNIKYILFVMCISLSVTAQQKLNKISKSVKVTDDVTIDLNTSYVQIEIDTWNKDIIEIEAYVESDKLSKEELLEALKNWDINVEGSGDYVSIFSKGNKGSWSNYNEDNFDFNFNFDALRDLEIRLADMPELPEVPEFPELPEMNFPNMPNMPNMPELPELPEGIHNVNFDTEAYKKDGEKYLEKWSKEYEEKYGKEYKEKMKVWARKFSQIDFKAYERDMEKWGEAFGEKFGKDYEEKMEAWSKKFDEKWGKEYEKKMEKWGEEYGKRMEERAKRIEERAKAMEERQGHQAKRQEELAKRMEERQERMESRREDLARTLENRNSKVKKVIKIKMPKDAKLKMNVRHGELKFTSVIKNLKADISHSTLVANHIDGSETSINVSYSPVSINTWSNGQLNLNYVDTASIQNAGYLMLNSNSSNINIDSLSGNAIIDGSFGDLVIRNITDTFSNLNLVLENSDASITLPKTNYNLQYKGNRSRFSHPKKPSNESVSTFTTGNMSSNKTIVVNAKFSHVVMQ